MIPRSFVLVSLALPALGLAQAPDAQAGGPKVEVMAEVVVASTQGDVIDPPSLEQMKAKFAEKTKYTSFRRVSYEKVVVSKVPAEVKLPNSKKATLTLEELKAGSAKLRVRVPPLNTVYTLGREGALYQAAGKYEGGDLWLVLSAVEGAR